MSNALKLLVAILLCAQCVPAQTAAPEGGAKAEKLARSAAQTGLRLKCGIACALSGHCAGREY
jgi:hypothetical protein